MSDGVLVLGDAEVAASLDGRAAVEAMREAVLAARRGRLVAPPRARAAAGTELEYVFTVGGLLDGVSGFRAYRAGPAGGDQLVAVWDAAGALGCVIVGDELGARRTGALGGLAADLLARPDAAVAGVIGSGRQAWTQLWALAAVRELSAVRVFSPSSEHRSTFSAQAREELGVDVCTPCDSAEAAVDGADVVVLADRVMRAGAGRWRGGQ